MLSRSSAVYSGFTAIPSGVFQVSSSGDRPLHSLVASSRQSSIDFFGNSVILPPYSLTWLCCPLIIHVEETPKYKTDRKRMIIKVLQSL
jgi:hypothetical protein